VQKLEVVANFRESAGASSSGIPSVSEHKPTTKALCKLQRLLETQHQVPENHAEDIKQHRKISQAGWVI
jgi:hypothetical protein